MLKNWQFNVLFFVGVGGAVVLLLGPEIGLKINQNPTAITGIGAILTYILTQKTVFTRNSNGKNHDDRGPNQRPSPKQNAGPKQDGEEDAKDV